MDKPKRKSGRNTRADATIKPITRADFHALVKKAAQPIKSDSTSSETLESHPSDDYTEKNTHSHKTVGSQD